MSLARFVERHAQFEPARVALASGGAEITYAELWRRVEQVTDGLAARLRVAKGDRIAFLGFNDPDLLVTLFALSRLGALLVPLNFRLAPPEHAFILRHAEVTHVVADPEFATHCQTLGKLVPDLRFIGLSGATPGWQDWRALTAPGAPPAATVGALEDPVLIVYTSGTTGRPKGAVHTQGGLIWNAVISTHAHALTREDHVLASLPMFHVGGLCIQTLPALHAGARVIIQKRFDPGAWLRDVQALRPSLALHVPATARAVIEHPAWAASDLSSLRMVNAGSSTVPTSLIEAFHARGVPVAQVYGSTETGPCSIYLLAEDARRKVGFAGKAGLHVDVRLVDGAGNDVPRGAIGEIWVRAPNVMAGYWRDPGNPAFRDGWFRSGDLAEQDEEGFYRVVGRSKDMIISGGENIYPAELENILADCPALAEATVVGVEDPKWGEVAVACVVKRADADIDEAAVLRLFEGRIARYKHPRRVVFLNALPKTALGKVQKAEVIAALAAGRS